MMWLAQMLTSQTRCVCVFETEPVASPIHSKWLLLRPLLPSCWLPPLSQKPESLVFLLSLFHQRGDFTFWTGLHSITLAPCCIAAGQTLIVPDLDCCHAPCRWLGSLDSHFLHCHQNDPSENRMDPSLDRTFRSSPFLHEKASRFSFYHSKLSSSCGLCSHILQCSLSPSLCSCCAHWTYPADPVLSALALLSPLPKTALFSPSGPNDQYASLLHLANSYSLRGRSRCCLGNFLSLSVFIRIQLRYFKKT